MNLDQTGPSVVCRPGQGTKFMSDISQKKIVDDLDPLPARLLTQSQGMFVKLRGANKIGN